MSSSSIGHFRSRKVFSVKATSEFSEIYLYRFPVDMRKYRNGLSLIVQEKMSKSIFSNALFIFTNRDRRIIRFIYWDTTGFAIWTKTLEKERYRWPKNLFKSEHSLAVSSLDLSLLLSGLDITPHKKLEYSQTF
jgi:transposase